MNNLAALPVLAGGRVPLQVALLSPAGRPIAISSAMVEAPARDTTRCASARRLGKSSM